MLGQILMVFAFVMATIAAVFITTVSRPPISVHFGWLAVAIYFLVTLLSSSGVK